MKNRLLIFLTYLITTFLHAQPSIEWQKNYGGSLYDEGTSVKPTSDGGYIIGGNTFSNDGDVFGHRGGWDVWVLKTDQSGVLQWKKVFGGTGNDVVEHIQQTTDGGYFIVGYSESNNFDVSDNHGDFDGWVVKLDSNGSIEWQNSIGGSGWDEFWAGQQTTDGGYIVAGRSASNDGDATYNHGQLDTWVVKLDAEGEIEWQRSYGGSKEDNARAMIQTMDGGYLVASRTASTDGDVTELHGNTDFWLTKLSLNGEIEWEKTLGGNHGDTPADLIQNNDGSYVITGYIGSGTGDVSVYYGILDYWVVKISQTGDIIWEKTLGGSGPDWARKIIPANDGGYIVAGTTYSDDFDVIGNDGGEDFWVVKVSNEGELVWQKSFGGTKQESLFGICNSPDGGYILTGSATSTNGDLTGLQNKGETDLWVIKLGPETSSISKEPSKLNSLEIFPNPASTEIEIKAPTQEQNVTVVIHDLSGNVLLQRSISNGSKLNVEQLPSGLYLIEADTEQGKKYIGRLEKF
ncbi:MAG: T9SS type A sorting domain-containing protein [Saprospiraceae bacterium]|nr:T9SS type A sorting domain-containing protein [Saprospiraceae bacterium]